MSYNEQFQSKGEETIKDEYIQKAGRIATKKDLLHLRDTKGELLPKKILVSDEMYILITPLTLGELEKHFPGLIWGHASSMDLKMLITLMAEHMILGDDKKLNLIELMDLFTMAEITCMLEEWFDMSGLKPDEATMQKAKEMGISISNDGINIGGIDPK